jgi:6-phosphogluconolactonase
MYSDTITPELGIPKLKKRVDPNLPISVLLFGMGADMHTASLFPGGDNLYYPCALQVLWRQE